MLTKIGAKPPPLGMGIEAELLFDLRSRVLYNVGMEYKTNKEIVYSCKYHVVWCSKYRRKVLVGDVERRLKELVQKVCAKRQAEIIEPEVMPDHINLLVEVDPQYGIHRLVKEIKGLSSRTLRLEVKPLTTRLPTLWTNSYFVSTVGDCPLSVIKQYIENQKNV